MFPGFRPHIPREAPVAEVSEPRGTPAMVLEVRPSLCRTPADTRPVVPAYLTLAQ